MLIANTQDTANDKRDIETTLRAEGLTPLTISIGEQSAAFTATITKVPTCKISGVKSQLTDQWTLDGFDPSWYTGSSNLAPDSSPWPPSSVLMADVATQHPQICTL